MATRLILFLILLSSRLALPAQDPHLGTYSISLFNLSATLDLQEDRSFHYDFGWAGCRGGAKRDQVWGTFAFRNDSLFLYPERFSYREWPAWQAGTSRFDSGSDFVRVVLDF